MTKYVIIVPDGAADEPLELFEGKTPLEAAETPNMDRISIEGRQGLVRTVPDGLEPGSDVAQMSLLGYDPLQYYSGRAPIEAAAKNIRLGLDDWVFRCNLVTIADGKMADHSAGHISTEEGSSLIKELQKHISDERIALHTGVSYRHLLVFKGVDFDVRTYPPHDHIGKPVEKLLPRGKGADLLIQLMNQSQQLFAGHEINKVRQDLGENQVSSIWLWGQGKQARLDSFRKRYGLKGAAITAVDLVRGLAKLVGFDLIDVPGATGIPRHQLRGQGPGRRQGDRRLRPGLRAHRGPRRGRPRGQRRGEEAGDRAGGQARRRPGPGGAQASGKLADPAAAGPSDAGQERGSFGGAGALCHGRNRESRASCTRDSARPTRRKAGLRIEKGCELMEYFLKS